jgi:hypothetical protein
MNDPTQTRYKYIQFKNGSIYRRFIKKEKAGDIRDHSFRPESTLNIPAHGSYGALLFHPKWKIKREEILKRDKYCCVNCKASEGLQVHHRQYHFVVKNNEFRLPWDYPDRLLITLCESCHNRGHNKYKVPIINI